MKTTHKRVLALMGIGALGIVGVAWAQSKVKLVINGNPVYTTTRVIGGKTYVPLNDVATALKMKVYPQGGQIVLRPAGGANQLNTKFSGKIGEELFTGKFRFIVTDVQETQLYNKRWVNRYNTGKTVEAADGEKLVVITARLTNGTKVKDEWAFTTGNWAGNTALTDMDARAYQPYEYDVAADENAPLGAIALPGASVPFALVFRVPQNAQIKDLVYTIVRYQTRADNKGTDVRVSLQR
jgi:hypothetical protein